MSQTVTLRLPDELAEAVRQIARREKRSVNEIGVRIVEEWVRQTRFPQLEFRSFGGRRHACIRGRLSVWETIMVARSYGMDVAQTANHLHLHPEQVRAAFGYYEAYPDEIDQALRDNDRGFERLKEILPSLELLEVDLSSEDEEALVEETHALLDGQPTAEPTDWEGLMKALSEAEPAYATLEDAMAALRMRPWGTDSSEC